MRLIFLWRHGKVKRLVINPILGDCHTTLCPFSVCNDGLQISLLIMSEFKQINELQPPLKSSE